jgi:hypothetical protein
MKRVFTLFTLLALSWNVSYAQRYLSEVFDEVTVTTDVSYGMNATVIAYSQVGQAIPQSLLCDIYEPAGDTETERPLILYFHTGNFLPHPQNGSPTGLRTDSAAVEICTRFAKMGYVVASCDYRLGWNPIASTQDERVYTLINAAYRGVQDSRTAVRFFRRSIAENNNPYGVDGDKIALWGQGTGGYITFASSTIDVYSDIVIAKFIRDVNGVPTPMVLDFVNGDPDATTYGINPLDNDTLCYPNHVGYSSDFNIAINMGGACGDISWVDETDNPMISFQVPSDPFAPYTTGTVIVPVLNLPVVEVSGSYDVQAQLNLFANNDVFQLAEDWAPTAAYTAAANLNNNSYHGLFPLVRPAGSEADSAPWEWWASTNPNNAAGLATNADMSAEKGRTYIDSIQFYAAPRMACALNLPAGPCYVGVEENEVVNFELFPNPSNGEFAIRSLSTFKGVIVSDMMGRTVYTRQNINRDYIRIDDVKLTSGIYLVRVITEKGETTERLIVE